MFKTSQLITTVTSAILLSTAACAREGSSIAELEHDLSGEKRLYSFAPEPATATRQIDGMHKRLYGIETKSPKTPYMCTWRDPTLAEVTKGRPTKPRTIFMACIFGTSDWTPPSSLLEEAQARNRRAEAVIRISWDEEGATYRMSQFDVEIHDGTGSLNFRSVHRGKELAEVRLRRAKTVFPASASEPFTFNISASAPYRLNNGDKIGAPTATLSISGTAMPMPNWVMY